jgi:hypothetical protein
MASRNRGSRALSLRTMKEDELARWLPAGRRTSSGRELDVDGEIVVLTAFPTR